MLIEKKTEELISYLGKQLSSEEYALVIKAFHHAGSLYAGKTLSDGRPSIEHYIGVAEIAVYELGLRVPSLIVSLLHGYDPDTEEKLAEIRNTYGNDVAIILNGFRRISNLPTKRISFQSEQFRKLFLSFVEDIRVVLLKIAHRLYDIRHPELLDEEKIVRFVQEIKHLYIPITHRLGLYTVKAEFEEKVMRFEHPETFKMIEEKIAASKDHLENFMKEFIAPIGIALQENGIKSTIKWRTKSIPSIWAKMKDQNVEFEQVYDLFAIRIIIDANEKKEKEECWRAYSLVTDIYSPNPKRLRDWITTPKASGYESLHTTVKADDEKWVEVQIRSVRMDQVAEKGQAAHWLYKDRPAKKESEEWLNQVRDVLENPDQLRFDAYKRGSAANNDKIFIFTPNGDLKQLPGGSTVLDFAYEVHTQVGSTCSGARVNNRIVPIRHVLQNGDKVEIIRSKKQVPKHDWLSFVVSDRAKSKIKRYLKEEELKEAEFGKELLLRKLKNWKLVFNDDIINHLVRYYKKNTSTQLYHDISTEKIDLIELKKHLVSVAAEEKTVSSRPTEIPAEAASEPKMSAKKGGSDDYLVIDNSITNVNYRLAKCCNPIPGDGVFGFVTINSGITVHRSGCPNASRLYERYSYRFIPVKWKESKESPVFLAAIRVSGQDTLGLVGEITKLISSDLKVNMRSIAFDTSDGRSMGKIVLLIRDTEHLEQLMYRIGKVNGVEKVTRID